ncbi:AfsR/SARP family transcriptional regulator [Actinocrispum wychmicini]|uniref:OmpR/PhoB-type domain-containing protein n=1 Tax=Actinocrispum wychmicini TaxID=1213861 RepID=A0A4R2JAS5_9PSEU|nr:hypothetical protein [Actinocrispum wychmicini]TCO53768.1 hypothetical protein EV192_110360 [Actinocrispum wychmicini]
MGEDLGGLWPDQPASWILRLVGDVQVCRAGTGHAAPVGSRKARILLAYLGARGGETSYVADIVEAVWAGSPPRDPAANVATLVSRLRARFGIDTIMGARTGYRVGELRVDLHEAAALVSTAENALKRAQPAYALLVAEQAIKLIGGGPVVAEHTADWAEDTRALQRSVLQRAWQVGADSARRTGAPSLARAMAETAEIVGPGYVAS